MRRGLRPRRTGLAAAGETDAIYVSGFEETDLPMRSAGGAADSSYDAVPDDALPISGGYDPYGTEAVLTPASFAEPTAAHTMSSVFPVEDSPESGESGESGEVAEVVDRATPRADTTVEDELEAAEFYASQGMYAEATDVLSALLARFPGHRMVLAKLREVETLAAGGDVALDVGEGTSGQAVALGGTDALDLDEIEEVGAEDLVELDADSRPIQAPKKRQPTVMLEKPVDESDADTHYDLGLAYKEMTLHDDAIKAFEKALRAPGREVGCRVMIGMCHRQMGNPSEAIHQFKQGLHAEPSERERQSLYYEIGVTYEAIGDDSEALYYFEMVLKRDPKFADAAVRADRLRARGGRAMQPQDDDI
ncbi:MAG TPA: tetratricopeptide repeat protein [Kofleriaceae bacterium]